MKNKNCCEPKPNVISPDFDDHFNHSSDTEHGFKHKLRMVEGENLTPRMQTIVGNTHKLGMDDIQKLRSTRLKKQNQLK